MVFHVMDHLVDELWVVVKSTRRLDGGQVVGAEKGQNVHLEFAGKLQDTDDLLIIITLPRS